MPQVSPQWSPCPHVERMGKSLLQMALDFPEVTKVDLESSDCEETT
jgi:hypothetical protein